MAEFLLRRGARTSLPDGPEWAERRGHDAIRRCERSGGPPPRRRQRYDAIVRDLIDTFASDATALQRTIEYSLAERAIASDRPPYDFRVARLRKAVLDRLENHRSAETTDTTLASDDARRLIARGRIRQLGGARR